MIHLDQFLFVVLPYIALFTFVLGVLYRYRTDPFTFSSLSSQFLENEQHFWAVVPFHFGIIAVLLGHVVAFAFPRSILLWNSEPLRLYILEVSALIFGMLTAIGLLNIMFRRGLRSSLRMVTSTTDWVLYALLLVQVLSGVSIAIFQPWGSSWFASALAPYLLSILKLQPDIFAVQSMSWLIKLHIVNAAVVIGFFPFTRLVHILVVPNPYLWRKPQVVRWYRSRRS